MSGREPEVPGPWLEIVGVVQDLYESAMDPEYATPMLYYAVAPGQLQSADLLVRVRGEDADGFAPRLRQIIASLDPDLRIGSIENLGTMGSPRYLAIAATIIVAVLGIVVLLSAAGIHALMSLTVTRRRKEIGIRTALGAQPRRVLASIFSRAAWQLGLGGLVGAALGTWLLVSSGLTDAAAVPLGGVIAIMLMAGLVAAVGPARRGLRIQPMDALREE
jgi:ABC-type antimicrobial peptide transport system permease subunit